MMRKRREGERGGNKKRKRERGDDGGRLEEESGRRGEGLARQKRSHWIRWKSQERTSIREMMMWRRLVIGKRTNVTADR
jgi:hypothetical protein